jgi:hypothetical protein
MFENKEKFQIFGSNISDENFFENCLGNPDDTIFEN